MNPTEAGTLRTGALDSGTTAYGLTAAGANLAFISSGILHVTDGSPTWGCVAVGRDEMRSLLTWLDPAASPRITIGVGEPGLLKSG